MIPQTFPSVIDANNRTKMVVYQVPSIVGLTRWVDYIPVKSPASESDLSLANTYANNGFILSNSLTSVTGLQAFKDYIPIYVDNAATTPWTTNANGYIPLSDLFSPLSLFASGEQGVWYDPSDFTTMFQDSTGTIPVTAVEQPVGLLLDKSKGLVVGGVVYSTNDFAGYSTNGGVVVSSGDLVFSATINQRGAFLATVPNLVVGNYYEITFEIVSISSGAISVTYGNVNGTLLPKSTAGTHVVRMRGTDNTLRIYSVGASTTAVVSNVSVKEIAGNHATQPTGTKRPVLSARYNLLVGTTTLATQNVTTEATNYILSFTGAGSITLSGTKIQAGITAGTNTITGVTAGTLTLTVVGTVTNAQLVPANQNNIPYQRVVTGVRGTSIASGTSDYDTDPTNFPPYLKFDGIDDILNTAPVNYQSTAKITVCMGLRKLLNGVDAVIYETSNNWNTLNPAFAMIQSATDKISGGVSVSSKYQISESSPLIAPRTLVFTSTVDTALLTNGANTRINTVDDNASRVNEYLNGTILGNYTTHIGARGGTANNEFYFTGNIYSIIVRGALSTPSQLSNTESYVNSKTKAY